MIGQALAPRSGLGAWLSRPGIAGVGLVAPAILLLVIVLLIPIGRFLFLSVSNPEVPELLPATVAELSSWDGRGLPANSVFEALRQDLGRLAGTSEAGRLARRLNFEMPGARTLILRTATRLRAETTEPRSELVALDARWGDPQIWSLLKRESKDRKSVV